MGRIALFVIAVGGLSYAILQLVVSRLSGVPMSRLVSASASVIVAVIAWTALIWIAGERIGGRAGTRSTETPPAEPRPTDASGEKEE